MSSERKVKSSRFYWNAVKNEMENGLEEVNLKAGYKIQAFLALQAWRRQKHENDELKFNIKMLSEKVNSLEMEKYALRQLLDAEKARLALLNNDVHKILIDFEEFKQEMTILLKEREQLRERIKELQEKFATLENEYQNQKNDLLTAELDSRNWEKQLEKEREKLTKIKSEKKSSNEEGQKGEESKEAAAAGANNRKIAKEARIKSTTCRSVKKNTARGREAGKVDFGKNK